MEFLSATSAFGRPGKAVLTARTGEGLSRLITPVTDDELSVLRNQDRHWGRHAAAYDDLFLDPFGAGVKNPLWVGSGRRRLNRGGKTAADLGCGTGPLLPHLVSRFGKVIALDFAAPMIERPGRGSAPSR